MLAAAAAPAPADLTVAIESRPASHRTPPSDKILTRISVRDAHTLSPPLYYLSPPGHPARPTASVSNRLGDAQLSPAARDDAAARQPSSGGPAYASARRVTRRLGLARRYPPSLLGPYRWFSPCSRSRASLARAVARRASKPRHDAGRPAQGRMGQGLRWPESLDEPHSSR